MVEESGYCPERGDVIWLNFEPQTGSEQSGRRPVVVLSPSLYNRKTGLLLACPVTSKVKGYPFEVTLPSGLPVSGVILSDHVKNVDWISRKADYICSAPGDMLLEVVEKLNTLIS